jgi:signal transduction histidine kinase
MSEHELRGRLELARGRLASEIVFREESLRRSLAAELHNGLGQDIALAKMKLATLRGSVSVDLHDALIAIEQFIERADRSLRTITFQISPPSLHDLGLVAALQWLGEDISQKYGIEVRIEDEASPGVADERIRVFLFRAVRELLINSARHAGVREAVVHLERRGELVRITVEDAGNGFDMTGFDGSGYGLLCISEQMRCVDGHMSVDSAPGRGTTVVLTASFSASVVRPTQ